MIGGTLLSSRQSGNFWEIQSRLQPSGILGWVDKLKILFRRSVCIYYLQKKPDSVMDLRQTRSDAIKSLLYPDRNCLQERVCASGVPEMKIGGHCRVP